MLRTHRSAAFRLRLWCGLLAILATLTLGCITTTVGVQVTHPWNADSEASVTIEFMQELDPQYAALVREANKDILAECAKSSVPCSENPKLPETLDEMMAQMGSDSGGLSGAEEEGFVRVEWAQGIRYRKTVPLQEYLDLQAEAEAKAKAEGEASSDTPHLEIHKDPVTGNTQYVMEMTFGGMGGDDTGDDEVEGSMDWAAWDAARQEPEPPKPPIQLPTEEGEAAEPEGDDADSASGLSGLGGIFEGIGRLGGDPSTPESALKEWHLQRIMKKMGFPTLYRMSFILPGDLVSHTMNGQSAGLVIQNREVVFSIDEAFLRQHGMGGPWVFRVESVVTPKMERAGGETKASTPVVTTPASAAPGQTYRRFRIRPLNNYTLGLFGGGVYASYELQELGSGGAPGRSCTIRFLGAGPMISAKFTPTWLVKDYGAKSGRDWVEFEINDDLAPMRLEDFDGVQGHHSDAGAFIYRWSGVIFGTRDSATDQVARVHIAGPQAGFYIGSDSAQGAWKIVKPPH
jgi:hypothetical protein